MAEMIVDGVLQDQAVEDLCRIFETGMDFPAITNVV